MKDIRGYEGHYAITEDGRVWSHKRNRFLHPADAKPYMQVQLWRDGKYKRHLVHRLVAIAYIPNHDDLPQVGHIDENPKNNHVSNLYWTDQKENNNHGSHNAKVAKAISKPVRCVELNIVFGSTAAAEREGGFRASHVSSCCCGKRRTHRGYHWEYVSEET